MAPAVRFRVLGSGLLLQGLDRGFWVYALGHQASPSRATIYKGEGQNYGPFLGPLN